MRDKNSNFKSNFKINDETEGLEEATEQIEMLAEAYDGFPAQVNIRNCRDCVFNIYPSQTKFIEDVGRGEEDE